MNDNTKNVMWCHEVKQKSLIKEQTLWTIVTVDTSMLNMFEEQNNEFLLLENCLEKSTEVKTIKELHIVSPPTLKPPW